MSNGNAAASVAAIKAIHEQGGFNIDGRKYSFIKMPFKKAKKIYAYLTVIAGQLEKGNLAFLDSDKFDNEIEPLLMQFTMVDGFKLNTLENHFDDFTCDYNQFVITAIQGFAAPFLPEAPTASASKSSASQATTLKKQM